MDKAALLLDLASKCGGVILSTDLIDTSGDVKRYSSSVFTTGSESDATAIAQKRNISFFVYKEGTGSEVAYYSDEGYRNYEERNPTGSTLLAIHGIFNNPKLRERVIGEIAKSVRIKMSGSPSDADKKVVKAVLTDINGLVDLFMVYVASNGTIQANGGAASDSDLDYVVQTEAWPNVGLVLSI